MRRKQDDQWEANDYLLACWQSLPWHADPSVVTGLHNWLAQQYDTTDKKLNMTWGLIHDYLGMNVNFAKSRVVMFGKIPYLNKIFRDFPEKITGVASSHC